MATLNAADVARRLVDDPGFAAEVDRYAAAHDHRVVVVPASAERAAHPPKVVVLG